MIRWKSFSQLLLKEKWGYPMIWDAAIWEVLFKNVFKERYW